MRTLALATLTCALLIGCNERPLPELGEPAPVPDNTTSIGVSAVNGKIAGSPFEVKAARYSIDRRPGHEKVVIHLLNEAPEKLCSELGNMRSTTVWLRKNGTQSVEPEAVRLGPKTKSPWEVHYEVYDQGRWVGVGRANLLLKVSAVRADMTLDGDLAACFGDANKSCVSGHFSATYCPTRIDAPVRGTENMERPPPGKKPWQAKHQDAPAGDAPVANPDDVPPGG